MKNIKLTIEYLGTNYAGWQIQPQKKTIQSELELALYKLTSQNIRISGAGRTDAGVHASGQVASFKTDIKLPPTTNLARALNTRLPKDIAVVKAEEIDLDFNPRHDCIKKQYCYYFLLGQIKKVTYAHYAWHIKWPLDIYRMSQATKHFCGTHDFTSFANNERKGENNTRCIDRCELINLGTDCFSRTLLVLVIEGRSFLYNMIRNIAGTLVDIGLGKFSIDDIKKIIDLRDRSLAGQGAPALGLCLRWIIYPNETPPIDNFYL